MGTLVAMCQITTMSGAIPEARGTLKRSDATGDREDHFWMRRLSLHLRDDHGKGSYQRKGGPILERRLDQSELVDKTVDFPRWC